MSQGKKPGDGRFGGPCVSGQLANSIGVHTHMFLRWGIGATAVCLRDAMLRTTCNTPRAMKRPNNPVRGRPDNLAHTSAHKDSN